MWISNNENISANKGSILSHCLKDIRKPYCIATHILVTHLLCLANVEADLLIPLTKSIVEALDFLNQHDSNQINFSYQIGNTAKSATVVAN